MAYSRDQGRISLWMGERPPVPGFEFGSHGTAQERWEAALPMIRWIADYEKWVLERVGPAWRQACRKHIRRLPRGKSWLAPPAALDWWQRAAKSSTCLYSADF
jgi:hypothetical protein